jgi:hypothetical protein
MDTNQTEEKVTNKKQGEELSTELQNKGRKRLNIDLTPDAYKLLQKLSQESGKNMTEVLRTGLALYGIAQEESQKGNSLSITDGEKIIARIAHL